METNNLGTNKVKDNEALTPAELIKRHTANSKHIISETEMKNLKVGGDAEGDNLINKLEEKGEEDSSNHHENNSYDILDA